MDGAAQRVTGRIAELAERGLPAIELLRRSARALDRGIPVDAWCGLTLDPATVLPTGGYHEEGLPPALVPRLLEIEYGGEDANEFASLSHGRAGAATLASATGGDPERSVRYREVLHPAGLPHELRMTLRAGGRCWGAMVLMRSPEAGAFTPADVALAGRVGAALGAGLRRSLVLGALEADGGEAPAVMVLRLDGGARVESAAPALARWRAAIDDGDDGSPDRIPYAVLGLARTALTRADAVARTRALGRDGTWMTMHATVLDRAAARVAVIRQPSRPHEILALTMEAHAVTARERQVVELMLRGHPNATIAERLVLSPLTVQDHLKSAFRKLGVAGRGELTARLVVDHYLPRIVAGATPDPDGAPGRLPA